MNSTFGILLRLLGLVARGVAGQVCIKPGVGHEAEGAQAPSRVDKALHSPWMAAGVVLVAGQNLVQVERQ